MHAVARQCRDKKVSRMTGTTVEPHAAPLSLRSGAVHCTGRLAESATLSEPIESELFSSACNVRCCCYNVRRIPKPNLQQG